MLLIGVLSGKHPAGSTLQRKQGSMEQRMHRIHARHLLAWS